MTPARRLSVRTILMIALPLAGWSLEPSPAAAADRAPDMAGLMHMDDSAPVGKVMIDQLEWADESGRTLADWDGDAWYGSDYDKAWIKSEGSPDPSDKTVSRNELLWDHLIARWWSLQTGIRYDLGDGPARGWATAGVEGLAPYGFNVEAALYLGEEGRTAARLRAEHDVLITQRLIVQPEIEADGYGKTDSPRQVGSGFSDLQMALRLRYEFRRELAPYVGIAWRREFGPTAQFARRNGTDPSAVLWVAGFHVWF